MVYLWFAGTSDANIKASAFAGAFAFLGGDLPTSKKNVACTECGTHFVPRTRRHKLCSKACRNEVDKRKRREQIYPSYNRAKRNRETALWRKKNPATMVLSRIKNRAPDCTLTLRWIAKRLDHGRCEVTGVPFADAPKGAKQGFNHNPWSPSVDRIDPEGPYSEENCRIVVWAYNRARGRWDDHIIERMAQGIVSQAKESKQ